MKNQRGIGIAMSYISVAIGFLTTMLYTPLINRILGMAEYGAYSWCLSIIQYLSILQMGLYATFTRYYSRAKVKGSSRDLAELNGLFLTLYVILGSIAFICGMVLVRAIGTVIPIPVNVDPDRVNSLRFLMILMVINISIDFPNYIFQSNIIVREQYFFSRLMNIVKQLLNPLLGIPMLLLGVGSTSLILATMITTITIDLANVWFCLSALHIRFAFHRPKFAAVKEIFTFSFYVFLTLVVDQMNWSVDKNILGLYANTVAVGVYTNADQLSSYFFSFASTISDVFTPKVHRIVAANKPDANRELSTLFIQIGRLQFMLLSLITIGFVAVGRPFVNYFTHGYQDTYTVAIVLFLATFISAIQYLGVPILQAKNMHRFKALLNFAVVFFNIVISIPLCKRYGALGAAIGTLIVSVFLNGLFINWYYDKKVGLDIPLFWKNIFSLCRGLVLPVLVMLFIVLGPAPDTITDMIIWGVVIVVVYCFSMLKWGMNRNEKLYVFNTIDRLVAKIRR